MIRIIPSTKTSIGNFFKEKDKTTLLFIAIATAFGLFFVFSTPLLWGADETTHVGRVYQISQGTVFSQKVEDGYVSVNAGGFGFGGMVPLNLKRLIEYTNYDFNVNGPQQTAGVKWVDKPQDYKEFGKLTLKGDKVAYNFSNTAIYSPVAYAPSVAGFKVAQLFNLKLGPTIYFGRIFALLFYVAVVAFVLRSIRNMRLKWVIFVVALMPGAVYQASFINADTVTIALALGIVGLLGKGLMKAGGKLTKYEFFLLLACAIFLPVAKPSYFLFTPLVLLIPLKSLPFRRYARIATIGSVVLGYVVFALWQYKTRYLEDASKYIIAGVVPWWLQIDESRQITYIVRHPLDYIVTFFRTILIADNGYFDGLFGKLGFNYVQVPAMAMMASLSAMVLGVMSSEKQSVDRKKLAILLITCLGTIGLIFTVLYITISSVAMSTIQGVQGRYFLPLLPLVLFTIVYASRSRIDFKKFSYKHLTLLIPALVVFSLLTSALRYFYVTWG